jgi:hypothetical protein
LSDHSCQTASIQSISCIILIYLYFVELIDRMISKQWNSAQNNLVLNIYNTIFSTICILYLQYGKLLFSFIEWINFQAFFPFFVASWVWGCRCHKERISTPFLWCCIQQRYNFTYQWQTRSFKKILCKFLFNIYILSRI